MMQIPGRRKDEKFTSLPLYGRQRVFERFADLPDLLHLYALFPTGKKTAVPGIPVCRWESFQLPFSEEGLG